VTLAFDRRGAGPVLVLLHPLGADRHVWEPVLDRLAAERDVIALDLPGFGESPALRGDGPPTPAAIARAVGACLDDLVPGRPVHVAGNSHGGWVALEMALAGRARSVTAIAPAGLWPAPLAARRGIARKLARGLMPVLPRIAGSPRGRRAALGFTVHDAAKVPPAAALRLLRAYALSPGYRAVNGEMRAGVFAGLERIRVPVTLAWPQFDRLIPRPAHLPPAVRNVTLAGCGHVPMWDDPAQVAAVVLAGSGGR
jgi:pimeloyl-ACP methyl ester carboxylesterase